jgi:hypothetical protein
MNKHGKTNVIIVPKIVNANAIIPPISDTAYLKLKLSYII